MYKFSLPFALLLLTTSAFATDAIIFNNSKNDVTITYQACMTKATTHPSTRSIKCADATEVTISGTLDSKRKNYKYIPQIPEPYDLTADDQTYYISIKSAVEKDNHGNVIAQANYLDKSEPDDQRGTSICNAGNESLQSKNNIHYIIKEAFDAELSDNNGSELITCRGAAYRGKLWEKL